MELERDVSQRALDTGYLKEWGNVTKGWSGDEGGKRVHVN
jgi:hypothetical protein